MSFRKLCFAIIPLLVLAEFSFSQIVIPPSEAFGDQLIIGYVGKPIQQLNPYEIDNLTEKQITRLIFGDGLIQQPDRFGQSPPLVEVFHYPGASKVHGLEWSYTLRRNINFQNGVPLRNTDVKFTFDMLKRWGGHILNRTLDFSNIRSIETSGDLEVRFILKQRDNSFDKKLSDIPILSRDYYHEIDEQGFSLLNKKRPLGYGPFRFESTNNDEIILVSHPHYVFGSPFLNRVLFKFYDNEQKMIDGFIQGEVDLIEISDRVSAERLYQILKNESRIFPAPRPEKKVYFLLFNVNNYPFQERDVRAAVRGAINPVEFVDRLIDQKGRLAYSIVDYTNPAFFKELPRETYDPELSMEILRKNGWQISRSRGTLEKNGNELSFELIFEKNSYLEESIARALKINLAEIGINMQPRPVSYLEKKALLEQNKFTAVLDHYSYYESDTYSGVKQFYFDVLKKPAPDINYSSPVIDNLFDKADSNPDQRQALMQRFQIFLHRDVPAVFLYFDDDIIYAVKNRFRNVRVSFTSDKSFYHRLNPLENWYVPKPLQKYQVW